MQNFLHTNARARKTKQLSFWGHVHRSYGSTGNYVAKRTTAAVISALKKIQQAGKSEKKRVTGLFLTMGSRGPSQPGGRWRPDRPGCAAGLGLGVLGRLGLRWPTLGQAIGEL